MVGIGFGSGSVAAGRADKRREMRGASWCVALHKCTCACLYLLHGLEGLAGARVVGHLKERPPHLLLRLSVGRGG